MRWMGALHITLFQGQPCQHPSELIRRFNNIVNTLSLLDEAAGLKLGEVSPQGALGYPGESPKQLAVSTRSSQCAIDLDASGVGERCDHSENMLDWPGLPLKCLTNRSNQCCPGIKIETVKDASIPASRGPETAGLQSPQRLARKRQRELESFGHGGNTQRLLLSEEIKNRETCAVGQHTTGSPQGRMECGRVSHDHTL